MLVAGLLTVGLLTTGSSVASAYDWGGDLKEGSKGSAVTELQIRVAGWAADSPSKTRVAVDGDFGPGTKAAVKRFQGAYGLKTSGVADSATRKALDKLEASDGTAHFKYSEFHSKDGAGLGGGKVGKAEVKENVRRMAYKLEAVRKKAGNAPITINSGFRSIKHNSSVGGASNSQHMYGIAADIVISGKSVAQANTIARTSGFSGIIKYGSFNHVDSRVDNPGYGTGSWYWGNA